MLKVAAPVNTSLKEVLLVELNQLVSEFTSVSENFSLILHSVKKSRYLKDLKIRPSLFKDSVMQDTGLLNSSIKMAQRLPQLLNITLLSTAQRDSTQMMPKNTSMKKEPLKDIPMLNKSKSSSHSLSQRNHVISQSQLQLKNQFTKVMLKNFNAKLLLKVLTDLLPMLLKKSYFKEELFAAQIS